MNKVKSIFALLIVIATCARAQDGVYNASAYPDLNTAISSIGANEITLAISQPIGTTGSLTVPDNIRLRFTNSGRIDVGTAQTLTIKSSGTDWPTARIFAGSGTVAFTSGRIDTLLPEWWGAKGDGVTDDIVPLQKAANAALTVNPLYNGGRIKLRAGVYKISDTWKINNPTDDPNYAITSRISILGAGRYITRIDYTGSTAAIRMWFNKHYEFSNVYIRNANQNKTGAGIKITGPTAISGNTGGGNTVWQELIVEYFNYGVDLGDDQSQLSGSEYTIIHCAFGRGNIGLYLKGGNTENIKLEQFFSYLNGVAISTLNANNIHIKGGSSSNDTLLFDLGTVGEFAVEGFRGEGIGSGGIIRGSGHIRIAHCTFTFQTVKHANDFTLRLSGPLWLTMEDTDVSGRIGLSTLEHGHVSNLKLTNVRWYNEDDIVSPFTYIPGSGGMAVAYDVSGNTLAKDSNKNLLVKAFDRMIGVNNVAFVNGPTPSIRIVQGPAWPTPTDPKMYLNTVKGISGSHIESKNLSGSVTITGMATWADVVFAEAEVDTNYKVFLSLEPQSTSVVSLPYVVPGTKTTSGFRIQLLQGPYTGTTVNWLVIR